MNEELWRFIVENQGRNLLYSIIPHGINSKIQRKKLIKIKNYVCRKNGYYWILSNNTTAEITIPERTIDMLVEDHFKKDTYIKLSYDEYIIELIIYNSKRFE